MFAEAFLCSRSKTVSGNGVRCLSHAQMWCYGSVVDSNSALKKKHRIIAWLSVKMGQTHLDASPGSNSGCQTTNGDRRCTVIFPVVSSEMPPLWSLKVPEMLDIICYFWLHCFMEFF